METLSQGDKEQLAIKILEEFACLIEAIQISSKQSSEPHSLPQDSVEYITNRYITALEMIDEVCESR